MDSQESKGVGGKGGDEAAKILMDNLKKVKEEQAGEDKLDEPVMESVSQLSEDQVKALDDSEIDRKSKDMQEKLHKKETELRKQAMRLEKLKGELKAIEAPMKQEILGIRTALEEVNRRESSAVAAVNELRKSLFAAEKELKEAREKKTEFSEKLIQVMADYEKRKMERLNELAEVVGDENKTKPAKPAKPAFGGF